ncbi:MAG: hypothetical protein R3344_07825, partial [Acidobacteriota bacterium]|nr:hypothetical protein [Acidobacteriota bacterium]
MAARIGIRKEDKSPWERRVPLAPDHVERLVAEGLEVVVQPSSRRVFTDEQYRDAGATLSDDLSGAATVFAVKEIPTRLFEPGKTYVYFAHVIKGQPYNMPMLRALCERRCTLIDYERVADEAGRRLILFGRHAGLAGMIDSLWTLGRKLDSEGHKTPYASIEPAHRYDGLEAAKAAVRTVGERIERDGLPDGLTPMVFGFAGYGNVSLGAQEIFDLLPHREVSPEDLGVAAAGAGTLIKVVFKEENMVVRREDAGSFDLQEYYGHPERYRGDFARHMPHLTVLMNCIYWAPQYPRLV